jgi:hypothetical protein
MLSPKQVTLFKMLDIPVDREKQVRANHKDSLAMIYFTRKNPTPKSFTTYLEHRLRNKWRAENERGKPVYVGD